MATLAPETSRWLLAADPGVAEPLAVVALSEASLDFVCFNLHNDATEVGKVKIC
jgi:hypothetical protein